MTAPADAPAGAPGHGASGPVPMGWRDVGHAVFATAVAQALAVSAVAGRAARGDGASNAHAAAAVLVAQAAVVAVVWWRHRHRGAAWVAGPRRSALPADALSGAGWGVAAWFATGLVVAVATRLGMPPPDNVAPHVADGGLTAALVVLLAVVGAPLSEELVFRRVVLDALDRHLPGVVAVGVQAAAFGALHAAAGPTSAVALVVAGVAFGWLWLRTRSLVAPVAAHAAFNAVSLMAVAAGT